MAKVQGVATGRSQSRAERSSAILRLGVNHPIAQTVALVCHGNAILRGALSQPFWPTNSTAQFCDRIAFVRSEWKMLRGWREQAVASTPDEWFLQLRQDGKRFLVLSYSPSGKVPIDHRMRSGFVQEGGAWIIQAVGPNNQAHSWVPRWVVWNQNAPDKRIWRVDYGMVGEGRRAIPLVDLSHVQPELIDALEEVRSFAAKEALQECHCCNSSSRKRFCCSSRVATTATRPEEDLLSNYGSLSFLRKKSATDLTSQAKPYRSSL